MRISDWSSDVCSSDLPAQFEIGIVIAGRHEEGGFAEVVLGGDCLKRRIVEPGVERHHRGRIAGEGRAREGVDLRKGDVHTRLPNQCGVTSASTSGLSVSTWPSGSTWISTSTLGNARLSAFSTFSPMSCAAATVRSRATSYWNCANSWSRHSTRLNSSNYCAP